MAVLLLAFRNDTFADIRSGDIHEASKALLEYVKNTNGDIMSAIDKKQDITDEQTETLSKTLSAWSGVNRRKK